MNAIVDWVVIYEGDGPPGRSHIRVSAFNAEAACRKALERYPNWENGTLWCAPTSVLTRAKVTKNYDIQTSDVGWPGEDSLTPRGGSR